jgi:predicted nucleic acid-binding protein
VTTIFLDTVGLLALWDESDQWHALAVAAMNALPATGCRFVSSVQVLMECGNSAARTPYRRHVAQFRQELADFGNLLFPSEEEERLAWEAYSAGEAAEAGIVDHVSFVLMRRLGITDAFTNDKHFVAAGFKTLF